jgi:hypothetical protein
MKLTRRRLKFAWKYRSLLWRYRGLIRHRRIIAASFAAAGAAVTAGLVVKRAQRA